MPRSWDACEGASADGLASRSLLLHLTMSSTLHHDELTTTVFGALQQLNQLRKASFLLDTALALIDAGQ